MDETAIGKPQIVLPLRHLRFENKLPLNLIKVKRFCILEGAAKECILEGAAEGTYSNEQLMHTRRSSGKYILE